MTSDIQGLHFTTDTLSLCNCMFEMVANKNKKRQTPSKHFISHKEELSARHNSSQVLPYSFYKAKCWLRCKDKDVQPDVLGVRYCN